MKPRINLLILCLIISGVVAGIGISCSGDRLDKQVWIERGRATLKPFKLDLKSALMEAMEDGPEAAIDVCSVLAPEIAADLSSDSVRVGRTSHRLRNNRNAPHSWLNPILAEFIDEPGKTDPQVVKLPDGKIGYAEPIFVVPLCLSCHGQNLAPAVAAKIKQAYPEDQALNFDDGDFRGLFWVEFTPAD